jgi:hypothetical protein
MVSGSLLSSPLVVSQARRQHDHRRREGARPHAPSLQ